MKKKLAILLIMTLMVNLLSPFSSPISQAAETSGFTLEHLLWDLDSYEVDNYDIDEVNATINTTVIGMLRYATASVENNFYDVEIVYPLPAGTTYVSASETGDVTSKVYDPVSHSVIYTLATDTKGNELVAGSSGELMITFTFNNLGAYPNGSIINLDTSTASWHALQDGSDTGTNLMAEKRSIHYTLEDSWSLSKTGTENITVPNDPTVTWLEGDYTIALTGGNINLKNIVITDILPANASIISSNIPYTIEDENVIWRLEDARVGETNNITSVIRYEIDRDGDADDEGVIGGRSRTNTASVTANDITTTNEGEIDSSQAHVFIKNSDSATTNFKVSTATWGIELTPTATVEIPLNPNIASVNEDYDIDLKGGDITLRNVVMVYNFSEDVTSVVNADGGSVDLEANTITWNIDTVTVGDKHWDITLAYDVDRDGDGGVKSGDSRASDVSITGYPVDASGEPQGAALVFNAATDDVLTSFTDMDIYWYANKTVNSAVYTLENISDDATSDTRTYYLYLLSSKITSDNIPLKQVTVIDTLPEHANYVSHTYTGAGISEVSFNQTGQVLTFVYDVTNDSVEPRINVVVDFKINGDKTNDDGVIPGDVLTNSTSTSATTTDDVPISFRGSNAQSSQNITFKKTSDPSPVVTLDIFGYNNAENYNPSNYNLLNTATYPGNKNYEKDDVITYVIDASNNNYLPLTGIDSSGTTKLLIPDLSNKIDFTEFKTGLESKAIDFYFSYQYDNDGIWHSDSILYNTSAESTFDLSSLQNAGSRLTDLKIDFKDDVPKNFNYSTAITLKGSLNSDAVTGDEVKQEVFFDYDFMEFGGNVLNPADKKDDVYFRIYNDVAWITDFSKTDMTNASSYTTNNTVEFNINFTTDVNYSTSDLENLTIVDYLPRAFNRETFVWKNAAAFATTYGIDPPTLLALEALVDGRTKITWQWPEGYHLPEGETFTLKYDVKFNSYAEIGTHTNDIYFMSASDYQWLNPLSQEGDDQDFDSRPETIQRLIGKPESVKVVETPSIINTKWIKGELDAQYSKYENVGITTPGGSADYKIEIFNSGNVMLNNVELIDIFPYLGDSAVTNPETPRKSLWAPYLLEGITEGEVIIVADMLNVKSKAFLSVEYSTARDPIRLNTNGSGTIGSETANWMDTPPSDITSVKSLRIRINNFKDLEGTPKFLKAGEKITIDFKMRAPVGAPYASTDTQADPDDYEAAWSSVSMTATKSDSSSYMLRNEPNKVGLIVKGNPAGEIGNFVWFDQNSDGIQNDGYDLQKAGINGVTVILKDKDNHEFDRTITAFDDAGNPGYYLFPNLPKNTYYVEYEIPSGYTVTTNDLGDDPTLDSDVIFSDGVWRTPDIIILDGISSQLDYDLGLKADINEHMDLTLTKTASGFKKLDNTVVNFGLKEPINVGESGRFEVYVENTGSLPLNNLLVEDQLVDYTFALSSEMISSDPNLTSVDDQSIKIKTLLPGDHYTFTGAYLIKNSDDTGSPLRNTVRAYANELSNKVGTPTYEEADDEFDIASLHVDKYVTHLKKVGTSVLIPATDIGDVGVSAGDTIYYEVLVTNTGSSDLSNVILTDQIKLKKVGNVDPVYENIPLSPIPSILKGQSAKVTSSYKVANDDEDNLTNIVSVTAKEVRTPATATEVTTLKGLNLFKSITAVNGNSPTLINDVVVLKEGDVVTYTIEVKNTSDATTYTNIQLADKMYGSGHENEGSSLSLSDNSIAILAPSASETQTLTYTVKAGDFAESHTKQLINEVALITDDGTIRKAQVPADLVGMTLTKEASQSYYSYENQVMIYKLKVKNKGTIDLDHVLITDPLTGLSEEVIALSVDQARSFTTNYIVKASDIIALKIDNTARATDDLAGEASDDESVIYRIPSQSMSMPTIQTPIEEFEEDSVDDLIVEEPEILPQEELLPLEEGDVLERLPAQADGSVLFVPKLGVEFTDIPTPPQEGESILKENGTILYTPYLIGAPDGFEIEYIYQDITDSIWIDFSDEIIPLGAVLPQTSEAFPTSSIVLGSLMIFVGMFMLFFRKKKTTL